MTEPWSTVAITSDDLFRDVNATFLSTYRKVRERSKYLPLCMRLGVPSTKRKERYGYPESVPTVDRWDRGESVSEDAARVIAYSVENLVWGKSIGFYEDDLEDLQLMDLRVWAAGLGKRAAQLAEEIFFQILTGASSPRLLEAIPNAPDGAALYAATAGGAARFGISGGNIKTGSGINTAQDVRNDLWNVLEMFCAEQDTEGQPLNPDDAAEMGCVIAFNTGNQEVFREAAMQSPTTSIVKIDPAYSGSEPVAAAGVANSVVIAGIPVILWPTQRITDNDWYVFLRDPNEELGPRPIFEQVRQAPRMMDETRENSERARRYRIMATILDTRFGFGVNLPYLTGKVNN